MKRLVLISDQHGCLPEVPECDLLLIGGDICPVDMPHDPATQRVWLDTNFRKWLEEVPARRVVGIAGNHDFVFEAKEHPRDLPWTYLIDSGTEFEGVSIWGTPWVPSLKNWAFCSDNPAFVEAETYDRIPEELDVLLTHAPPKGCGDKIPAGTKVNPDAEDIYMGCSKVKKHILRAKPRVVVTGHIHGAYGVYPCGESRVYNAALNDEYYGPRLRKPFVLEGLPGD